MKVKGIDFDVEVEWDSLDGRIDSMAVFLSGSDVELSDVLSEEVLKKLEETYYKENPYGDECPEDMTEDR
jgi:hypothetical protein